MKKQYWLMLAFFAMVLFQLYAPLQMIWEKESILSNGNEFYFKTRPVDPNDPFRGKFISLSCNQLSYPIEDPENWDSKQEAFVTFGKNENGIAKIIDINNDRPLDTNDYAILDVNKISESASTLLKVHPPFNRF